MDLMTRRRVLLAQTQESGVLATATGNPLSFTTDLVRRLHSLVIPFSPVQAAGTPSPDNPLPISGLTGANIQRCGKNLFNKNDPNIITGRYFNRNGTITSNVNYAISYVPINPGDKLVYSGLKGANGNPCGIQFFDASKNFLAMGNPAETQQNNATVTAPNGAAYIGISVFYLNNVTYKDIDTAQLEIGTIPSEYETYHSTTLPINWQTEAGTIYSGTVTLNEDGSADVVVDCANYHILPSDWSYQASVNSWYVTRVSLSPPYLESASGDSGFYGICDNYPFAQYAAMVNTPLPHHIAVRNDHVKAIYCMTDGTSDTRPVEINIVLKVAEPVTYHFDNVGQLYTYLGSNTIWTDTNGTNTAEYWIQNT